MLQSNCELFPVSPWRWMGWQVFSTHLFPKGPRDDSCVHLPPDTPMNRYVVGKKLIQPWDPSPLDLEGTLEFILSPNLDYSVRPFLREQICPRLYNQLAAEPRWDAESPNAQPALTHLHLFLAQNYGNPLCSQQASLKAYNGSLGPAC